jgi:RNA polymerase sigma-70 factor (ECF subfamily)
MSEQNLERILRDLRPKLHRFCSRMVGSVLDGEDHLDEVAEIIESTVGGVKAALHRGRGKLRGADAEAPPPVRLDVSQRALLDAYVDRFTRRDWDGLRALIQADARLELVGVAAGTMLDIGKNYFSNYLGLPADWRFTVQVIDGEVIAVHERRIDGDWPRLERDPSLVARREGRPHQGLRAC